ncbi:hypothetical protein AM588_10010779 [Phytophthora nicotianae]|uniref:Uncharacterized protein n=1 Tax=Phytophthora nicotianae TaxID=4792 RepID=A0A0W8DJ43_PHYNI|nr:hypothetical protein AM588_10010779 [Phytophthora nicotianae]
MSSSSSSSSSNEVSAGGVVTASDCAWEQVTDSDSCYVQPRSCYDCLNTPLSNGQLCNIFRARRREVRWQNMLTQSIAVRRPTTGLTLELSAWKEMHDGLIADERNVGNAGHRLADASNDAPMVTVEEGDGYRPMSPSVPVLPASPPSPTQPLSTFIPSRTQRASV